VETDASVASLASTGINSNRYGLILWVCRPAGDAHLLAETRTNREEKKINQVKTDANLKEMKEEIMAKMQDEMKTDQERMEVMIDANNEKVEVLRNKMWASQEEMAANPGEMKSVV
jgi:hypothetical protein